jgi:hypothetical protein
MEAGGESTCLVGSPDEKAVLEGASAFGVVTFEGRDEKKMVVRDWNGVKRKE